MQVEESCCRRGRNAVVMFPTPFAEAPLKRAADDVKDDGCLFDEEDTYSEWGLLTPPWSPCDSYETMDSCTSSELPAVSSADSSTDIATTRSRCDSFLCSCTSCECSGLERVDGPVLRDCMWSQTTGLLPPRSLAARHAADASADDQKSSEGGGGADCRPCCPAITAACTNHTARCVDPKNVFPCSGGGPAPSRTVLQTFLVSPDCSVTKSPPVYDPDSETSAYCSSFSGWFSDVACKFNSFWRYDSRHTGCGVPSLATLVVGSKDEAVTG